MLPASLILTSIQTSPPSPLSHVLVSKGVAGAIFKSDCSGIRLGERLEKTLKLSFADCGSCMFLSIIIKAEGKWASGTGCRL